jgi:hypothetical protein
MAKKGLFSLNKGLPGDFMKDAFLELAPDLWTVTGPLRFYGMQIGTRMTVVRLSGGGLWLHSPVALSPELLGRLQERGEVRWVVAPNRLHHLFVGNYLKTFPLAKFYAAPGLSEKRPDLKFTAVLSSQAEADWSGLIDQQLIEGFRFFNEVVFFHRASRTLILTDLITYFTKKSSPGIKLLGLCMGFYNRPAFLPHFKKRIARRPELRASLRSLLEWDFTRVVLAHGDVLSSAAAFRDLLERITLPK